MLIQSVDMKTGKAAKVNPDLALAISLKSGEPCVLVQQADMFRLEDALTHMREAQNYILVSRCLLLPLPVYECFTGSQIYGRATLPEYAEGLGGSGLHADLHQSSMMQIIPSVSSFII